MQRILLAAGLLGASAVALGAYAAHGLGDAVASFGYAEAEVAKRVANFVTGSRYQLATAVALLAIALAEDRRPLLLRSAWLLAGGTVVFSGLLYALAFVGDGWRWLGAVVPLGGLAMIAGWLLVAVAACLRQPVEAKSPDRDLAAELVRLEEVITHQQRMVQDLNESITASRSDSDDAVRRQNNLEQTVRRLVEMQQGAEDLPDERPPHY